MRSAQEWCTLHQNCTNSHCFSRRLSEAASLEDPPAAEEAAVPADILDLPEEAFDSKDSLNGPPLSKESLHSRLLSKENQSPQWRHLSRRSEVIARLQALRLICGGPPAT